MNFKIYAFCFLIFTFLGCGYTSRSSIYPGGTSIAVKPFINKINISNETSENARLISYFPLLETKVTNAVVDRFILDGNLKVHHLDNCDLILEGEIVKYQRDAMQYTNNNEDVTEYRVTIFCNLKLRNAKTESIIWQEDNFGGNSTYYTQGPVAKSESSAVEDAVSDLSQRIVERVVEPW